MPGVHMLNTEVEAVIRKLIDGYYLTKERPRVIDLHRQVDIECRRKHLPCPSYKAVWARVNQLDPALKCGRGKVQKQPVTNSDL